MRIGKFEVDVVDTGLFGLDGGSMFGVVPKPLWTKYYAEPDSVNRIPLATRPLLIRVDGKNILVDAGNGTKLSDKLAGIYNVDREKSDIRKGLAHFGLTTDDINIFIYTHFHFDHAGGSTIKEGNEVVPVFKYAKHYVQKEHYEWSKNATEKDRASFMPDDYMPVLNAGGGMLEFLDGEGEILPGLSVIPINGHTKSLQMIKLEGDGQSLLYVADLAPTAAHLKESFGMGYDNFPLTTLAEKKKYFKEAAEQNTIIVFEHDAFRQAGTVKIDEKGFSLNKEIEITNFNATL